MIGCPSAVNSSLVTTLVMYKTPENMNKMTMPMMIKIVTCPRLPGIGLIRLWKLLKLLLELPLFCFILSAMRKELRYIKIAGAERNFKNKLPYFSAIIDTVHFDFFQCRNQFLARIKYLPGLHCHVYFYELIKGDFCMSIFCPIKVHLISGIQLLHFKNGNMGAIIRS